tara:strand:+ start:32 stop:628 length:597 start_codon:yes stop_codon:yes gene_type:complete
MIKVEDKIISLDVFEKHFVCDLNACKGACCVEGDSGAPITVKEEKKLKKIYKDIKPYMRKEGILEIENKGVAVLDFEGELTTPLVNGRECAFVFYENKISKCAIEKAYIEGKTNFKKPISCHLFPIRIKQYLGFDAVNYEKIKICKPARRCGAKLEIRVYEYLKEPLIRKYGEKWYAELLSFANMFLDVKRVLKTKKR